MFSTVAHAQTTAATGPAGGGGFDPLTFALPVALLVLFYFMILRPQQRRQKAHTALLGGIKRGDTVVMSSGIIGKVTKVEDAELSVEIAPTVNVKVVKGMITDVRNPTAANDAKA